ncbi:Aldolase-type TIM barrel [Metarhizium album ARSEF 1941]|uniref:Aldolase-type TIM barrel n=1 Tax=Metarhizium album (strain ARSEF 1941) TaxID=1081103 RepID=A0A0B2X8M1_METAS|nr:Aldolase-type TIM barrel [Metarhizium album ARSEF 1941]KHO01880.1 Aldolase-type TIM barrel [Metarhizium album ARSEF 1941]
MASSNLFKPLSIGNITVKHRLALAPLTRFRVSDDHVPLPITVDYYRQRSHVPGTLLVTEATIISPLDGGQDNVPGIWNEDQINAWRKVTDAVHENGSYIFAQLWSLGRVAEPDVAAKEGISVVGADTIPTTADSPKPHRLSLAQIQQRKEAFVAAAKSAIAAGFDGIELHGANGYLIDQFLQDVSNQRDDEYGGSVENRSRFAVEVATAVAEAIGPERTAVRLSPWSKYGSMGMADPVPQFTDVIQKLDRLNLAYLHLVESRVAGNTDVKAKSSESLDFAYELWNGPLLVAGGFLPQTAKSLVDEEHRDKDIVVVFGRRFLATPDLPFRVKNGIQLNEYNRDTFYTPKSPVGYIDYPFSREFLDTEEGRAVKVASG